jgi:hypothetical protein
MGWLFAHKIANPSSYIHIFNKIAVIPSVSEGSPYLLSVLIKMTFNPEEGKEVIAFKRTINVI